MQDIRRHKEDIAFHLREGITLYVSQYVRDHINPYNGCVIYQIVEGFEVYSEPSEFLSYEMAEELLYWLNDTTQTKRIPEWVNAMMREEKEKYKQ